MCFHRHPPSRFCPCRPVPGVSGGAIPGFAGFSLVQPPGAGGFSRVGWRRYGLRGRGGWCQASYNRTASATACQGSRLRQPYPPPHRKGRPRIRQKYRHGPAWGGRKRRRGVAVGTHGRDLWGAPCVHSRQDPPANLSCVPPCRSVPGFPAGRRHQGDDTCHFSGRIFDRL
jgi:hypothetical protein